MDYDVIVIGAGISGLCAGAVLAEAGLETLVVEQADGVGGCASSFAGSGFQFDVGACIVEVIRAHEAFYERLGLHMDDYVTFIPNDPLYELVDPLNGERFAVPASCEGTAEIIGRRSRADALAFMRFVREQGRLMDAFTEAAFTTPQCGLADLLKACARYPQAILGPRHLMLPFNKVVGKLFAHPFTRRLVCNSAAIGGLPPSRQVGMMLWQTCAEHAGMYYPRGGMGAVPLAMARALEDMGGEIWLGSRVDRLHLEGRAARGVHLDNGTTITSRAVVSSANAASRFLQQAGEERMPCPAARGLRGYELSPGCAVGYLGLDYRPPMQAQYIMAMADPEFVDPYWRGVYDTGTALPLSAGLISCPSRMDPSLAPEGGAALSFVTLAPRHPRGAPWSEIKWEYLERGIDMLDAVYLPGIRDHVVFKAIATPEDFEARMLMPHGSIYAYSMSVLSQTIFRSCNRSRCIKDLYLSGAGAHPSGSVPGAIYGGMLAADLALKDLDGGWRA